MDRPLSTVPETQDQAPAGKGAFVFIFMVILLDIVGLTILHPVQVLIVRQYSTDALAVTMLTVIYAGAQFFCAPILGALSDHLGRRPVLLLSVLGSAFGYYLFGIGGSLWVLFLSRLIDGITGGNISTAIAYVADVTPPQERAKSFALIGTAFGLGFIIGPAIGGLLSQLSLAAPAYAAGTFALLSAGVGFFVLPESLPQAQRRGGTLTVQAMNPFISLTTLARRPVLGQLLLVMGLFYFAFNAYPAVFAVFALDKFGASPLTLSALFVLGGIANAVIQAGLVGRLAPVVGEKKLAIVGLLSLGLGFVAIVAAPALWTLFPITLLSSSGPALIYPTLTTLLANQVPQHEQGQVAGVSASLSALMSVFGPVCAGIAYDRLIPSAPFWSGAVLLSLAALVLTRARIAPSSNLAWQINVSE